MKNNYLTSLRKLFPTIAFCLWLALGGTLTIGTAVVSSSLIVGCATHGDRVVTTAEKATTTSFYTANLFVHLEYDNPALVKQVSPNGELHKVANSVRKSLPAFQQAQDLKLAYQASKTIENKNALERVMTVVGPLLDDINFWLPKLQAAGAVRKG